MEVVPALTNGAIVKEASTVHQLGLREPCPIVITGLSGMDWYTAREEGENTTCRLSGCIKVERFVLWSALTSGRLRLVQSFQFERICKREVSLLHFEK